MTSSISVPNIIALKPPGSKSAKQTISTVTLIDVRCETPETDIYYTIDGNKPDPFSPFGAGKSSVLYTKPFTLPPGKITVKAIAYSKDKSRESRHVSKSFLVEGDENNNNESKSKSQPNSPGPNRKPKVQSAKSKSGTRSTVSSYPDSEPELGIRKQIDPSLASAIICPSCCAPRPKGSTTKFCTECGTLYPDQLTSKPVTKTNPNLVPALGTMGMCVHCRSYVPLNIDYCIVCEAPIKPQLPKPNTNTSDKLQCQTCSNLNPIMSTSCLICEGPLDRAKRVDVSTKPPMSITATPGIGVMQFVKCTNCGTNNEKNALFCANCGKKKTEPTQFLTCPKCKLQINPGNKFCLACGTLVSSSSAVNSLATVNSVSSKMLPMDGFDLPKKMYPMVDKQVQTTVTNMQISTTTATTKLSAVSPGKGFWRKQLEHVVGHLKQYTMEMPEFQKDISSQKLGKIVGASVDEEEDIFTICIDFQVVPNVTYGDVKSKYKEAAQKHNRPRPPRRAKSADPSIDDRSRPGSTVSDTTKSSASKSTATRQSRDRTTKVKKLNEQSEELLKELQMPDQNIDDIIQLLDDGADPNCKNSNGVPAIGLAISNNFLEAIKPLVDGGANINAKYGANGNSGLHEAVLLGHHSLPVVTELVKQGADVNLTNKRGETAHDLALKANNIEAAEYLATHITHKMLLSQTANEKPDEYEY